MGTKATLQKNRSIRKAHQRAAISVWVAMLGSVLLYLLFVWLSVWRPHIAWWWLTAGLVVLPAAASFCLMVYQLFGRGRIRAIGVFMISLVPLIWLASFLWSTINALDGREDLNLSTPVRALGLWAGSYFELEARWRYPRITEGKHATLFDNGVTPNIESLVADMDEHIEQMAATLETPVPKVKARWVRGPLFGQHGRAVGAWAICAKDENVDQLDYLDRHEVAHVTLTMMCPVSQDMPMLLAEGWAQSQSVDPAEAILSLSDSKRNGDALSLNEIITDSYGRSTGPAYKYGGPLVMYLIERFGGPKFVELYGGVGRKSFPQDVERITGVAWDQLEEDFWNWLESRRQWAKQNSKKTVDKTLISFGRAQDKPLWQQILASAKLANTSIKFPDNAAFVETSTSESWNGETRYVFEEDCMWQVMQRYTPTPVTEFQIATPDACGRFVRKGNEAPRDAGWSSAAYKQQTRNTKSNLLNYSRLTRLLMIDREEFEFPDDQKLQIHSIQPQTDSSAWKLCFTRSFGESDENTQRVEVLLNSDHFFDVVGMTVQEDGHRRLHKLETNSIEGIPIVTRWTTSGNEGVDFTRTISALSADEVAEVKQDVEEAFAAAAAEKPASASWLKSESWADALLSPIALAIVWPSLGVMFLLIDLEVLRS